MTIFIKRMSVVIANSLLFFAYLFFKEILMVYVKTGTFSSCREECNFHNRNASNWCKSVTYTGSDQKCYFTMIPGIEGTAFEQGSGTLLVRLYKDAGTPSNECSFTEF